MGFFKKPLPEPSKHEPRGKAKMKGSGKSGSSSYHGKGHTPFKKK